MCVCERDPLVVFGSTDDGDGLGQHQLIGAVSVQVDTGEEGCLSGMSLNTHTHTHTDQRSQTQTCHSLFRFCEVSQAEDTRLSGAAGLFVIVDKGPVLCVFWSCVEHAGLHGSSQVSAGSVGPGN